MSQNAGSYFSKILKLFFPKGTCPRIQLREHVALQNAMLAMQGLFKSATNPVQIIHIPTFFFCSVWQPKRAYLGKLVTKLCCIVRRAYRIILIVSSVSGSFNLFISSFSDPTFSKPHSTSSSVILFHCRIFLSICTSHIVVTESACSFVLTRIAKLPFLLEFSYILRFVDNCCKLNMERNIGHFVSQLKLHGLVCLAW